MLAAATLAAAATDCGGEAYRAIWDVGLDVKTPPEEDLEEADGGM